MQRQAGRRGAKVKSERSLQRASAAASERKRKRSSERSEREIFPVDDGRPNLRAPLPVFTKRSPWRPRLQETRTVTSRPQSNEAKTLSCARIFNMIYDVIEPTHQLDETYVIYANVTDATIQ